MKHIQQRLRRENLTDRRRERRQPCFLADAADLYKRVE